MQNSSYNQVVLSPLVALLEDVCAAKPELRPCLASDIQKLDKLVTTRGLRILTIDFPDVCKEFDKSLSRGGLSIKLPQSYSMLLRNFEIFSKLNEEVFDKFRRIYHEPEINAIFFIRQILSLYKKIKLECSDENIKAALGSFESIESEIQPDSMGWDSDTLAYDKQVRFVDGINDFGDCFDGFGDRDYCPQPLIQLLDQVSGILSSRFPEIDHSTLSPRHGPGAVADAQTGTDKYLFRNWPNKLGNTFSRERYAFSREDLHLEENETYSLNEPPARLLAVPKTMKGPRLITSEPTAHQFLQQGLLRWFRDNIPTALHQSIDFKSQVPSRELVLKASADSKLATVDLSSASDRLSCWTIERFFRSNESILTALHASRSRWVTNATGKGIKFNIKLKKFAGQGSAVTFPLQSFVYAGCCYATLLYMRGMKATYKNICKVAREVRVYGDDIILPSHATWHLSLLLEFLQLKVNDKKTHWQGRFRESCGMDGFGGYNVTPVYLSHLEIGNNAEALLSWVDVSNNAHKAGLWALAGWMQDQIPVKIRKLIPVSNSETLSCISLHTFLDGTHSSKKRFSPDLQRNEVLGFQVLTKERRRRRTSHHSLLQYFTEVSPEDLIGSIYPSFNRWVSGYVTGNRSHLSKRWVCEY